MDNVEIIGGIDRNRININEYYEVEYWSKTLGVSPEVLKKAVAESGTSADAVRKHLNK